MRSGLLPAIALLATLAPNAGAADRLQAVPVFPKLKFERPLYLTYPRDGTDRIFVVEQDGRILCFENKADVSSYDVAIDIRSRVRREGEEEGLLGFAFHPAFKANRHVFLHYSATPRRNVLSRFTMSSDGRSIDPASEKVLLEVPQPYSNHNGGMIDFGPDGFLYVALGDGGSAGDPQGNAQNTRTLLGKILRLDVDRPSSGRAYGIPPDNPFARSGEGLPEIFAWGLRNPWRFSFDRETGELWAGDVGQNAWEEIDIVRKGGNYGWDLFEGNHVFERTRRPRDEFEWPVAEIDRLEARSITGGYVYRGKRFPRLRGAYIYGDFVTGKLWTLRRVEGRFVNRPAGSSQLIASFGEDRDGEIHIVSFDGRIYEVRPQ